MDEKILSLIGLLIARLERISADSFWAHRASGVKGSLLRLLEKSEKGHRVLETEIQHTVDLGFLHFGKGCKGKKQPKKVVELKRML